VEAAVQSRSFPLSIRFRVVAWTLLGQFVSIFCVTWLSFILGFLLSAPPFSAPSLATAVLFLLLFIGVPVLCSWAFVRRYSAYVRPLLVSICSCVIGASPVVLTAQIAGGNRQALGAMSLPLLLLVPLASILGSFCGTYIPPSVNRRAG